jgi:hypothetical protein
LSELASDAAVWSPGTARLTPITQTPPLKTLHIEMKAADKFVLTWKQGGNVITTLEVPRKDIVSTEGTTRVVRFPELAEKVASEWKTNGTYQTATDKKFDQAVLHTDNETPYGSLVGVIDAVYQVHRPFQLGSKVESVPAFNMTFSVN